MAAGERSPPPRAFGDPLALERERELVVLLVRDRLPVVLARAFRQAAEVRRPQELDLGPELEPGQLVGEKTRERAPPPDPGVEERRRGRVVRLPPHAAARPELERLARPVDER